MENQSEMDQPAPVSWVDFEKAKEMIENCGRAVPPEHLGFLVTEKGFIIVDMRLYE